MRKYRSYSVFQRALSALLCLSMVLSVVTGTDLPELFDFTEIVDAAGETPDPNEYANETLENMWGNGPDDVGIATSYWNSARSYYTCVVSGGNFAQFGGVNKRTIFHVYAFEGETICLGSSVCNSGLDLDHKLKKDLIACGTDATKEDWKKQDPSHHYDDKDSVDIVMTDLKGNQIPIDIRNSEGDTTGYIASPQAEYAAVKMTMKKDGTFVAPYTDAAGKAKNYTPYTYKVKESGVYTFEFHSYDGTGTSNPSSDSYRHISSQWADHTTNYIDTNGTKTDAGGLIAALNITVFDENCEKQTGRTYADCLSLQMGDLSSPNKNVTERYYVLTTDSYIYKMQFNDAKPYTYNFFANNRGIFDNATGEIVYKSVKDVSNTNVFQKMGTFFVYPGNKETEKDKSFYIFLEYPDPDLEGEVYQKAVQPDPATNIRFVGQVEIPDSEGVKKVPGAYVGVGGYFAFDVKEATTATLRLDFKNVKKKANTASASSLNFHVPDPAFQSAASPTESEEETITSENSTEDLTEIFTEELPASEESTAADPTEGSSEQDETEAETAASGSEELPTDPVETAEDTGLSTETEESTEELTEEQTETNKALTLHTPNSAWITQEETVAPTDTGYEYAPVEISGVVKPNSTNYFYWDGCDGNGVPIPVGEYSLDDIVYTVTTKAGEIHFPIFDMESAAGGITFTRMSHIYDKNGIRLDYDDNIYGMTKNVIYYDETAIYYGENVAVTGISEDQVEVAKGKFNKDDGNGGKYHEYDNMKNDTGSEYNARNSSYIKDHPTIRVGDHSHTTNVIKYFSDGSDAHVLTREEVESDQKNMIDYLSTDKAHYPAGMSTGGNTTTDYAIANYWTFIPAKPATAINTGEDLHIIDTPAGEELCKLSGRVFYDGGTGNGVYDDSGVDGEHLLSGVTLKLYKITKDTSKDPKKEYYNYSGGKMEKIETPTEGISYELVDTGITRTDGSYVFTNLTYNKDVGTDYLYEVVRPNTSYEPTSEGQKAAALKSGSDFYGYYSNHSYDENGVGTEIQKIKIGGDGVDPKYLMYGSNVENVDNSVCAVDVGYKYDLFKNALTLKKEWDTTETHPDAVVYELSYCDESSQVKVYDYRTLSAGGSWSNNEYFLPAKVNGNTVNNYYISAEYFIKDNFVYKYVFDYDSAKKKYHSFVATPYRIALSEIFGTSEYPANCSIKDLPDKNGDGVSDGADMGAITGWTEITAETTGEYRAVLDRDMPSGKTEITITNSKQHGTIEIYKHKDLDDMDESEANALQGATFRLYLGDMNTIKDLVAKGNNVDLAEHYIASATTRANGRLTFTGLDPGEIYTVREVFAPDGYRIVEEFYEVRPATPPITTTEENVYQFGNTPHSDYVEFAVGNAQADNTLCIRKQITGRAWQDGNGSTEDKFTFTILNSFNATSISDMTDGDHDIKIEPGEIEIIKPNYENNETTIMNALNAFAKNFQEGEKGYIATIDYNDGYYSYTDKDSTNKEVTYTSADTKMSDELLTGSTENVTSDPKFLDVPFPMAGDYTFTIEEEKPAEEVNLEYSPYKYKVTISVIRKYNDPTDEEKNVQMTTSNTHLEAGVSKITYSIDDTNFRSFASSSPLFTNTYKVAPAEQITTYQIQKNFVGRDWTDEDEFTVTISSADSDTISAVKNENLTITGFTGKGVTALPDGAGWEYTFTNVNKGPLKFNSFKFNDIEFPVQYVDEDGEVWKSENPEQTIPTEDEIKSGNLTPKTMPVTYTFHIKEDLPEGDSNVKDGITYDDTEYTLTIVLNNTDKAGSGTGEEEDGIIEEIDVTLSNGDNTSECITRQGVMKGEDWLTADGSEIAKENELSGSANFYYVDDKGNLKERSTTAPTDAKLYFWKCEQHNTTSGAFGSNGHTMMITNEYHTSYEWMPQIEKILKGRTWLADDKFTFTITRTDEGDADAVTMPSPNIIEITNKDTKIEDLTGGGTGYLGRFGIVEFHKPGIYTFNIEEKAPFDGITVEKEVYEIEVTVKDDDHNGKMTATFNGYEANTPIRVVNTYKDKDTSFDFGISKTIKGREWKSDDSFSFTVTPADDETKKAIEDKVIVMPEDKTGEWEKQADNNSYKATIKYTDGSSADPKTIISKTFGKIQIVSGSEEEDTYQFTIQEDTTGLDAKHMKCLEDKITLIIHVKRDTGTGSLPTGNLLVTYAYMGGGASSTESGVIIPFTNECRGQLTVAKKVVSNAEKDTTPFEFKVEFTFVDDADTNDMKATRSVTGEEVKTTDKTTYTFTLADGENVVFDNIPPYTKYTITETEDTSGKYVLLRARDHATDDKEIVPLTDNSLSGKINGDDAVQYRLFVNGLYKELPSGGGVGIQGYIFYGTVLTVGAVVLFAMLYCKRRKRSASKE